LLTTVDAVEDADEPAVTWPAGPADDDEDDGE
jgi:hypothetical protein